MTRSVLLLADEVSFMPIRDYESELNTKLEAARASVTQTLKALGDAAKCWTEFNGSVPNMPNQYQRPDLFDKDIKNIEQQLQRLEKQISNILTPPSDKSLRPAIGIAHLVLIYA
jgi:hypothetical protein